MWYHGFVVLNYLTISPDRTMWMLLWQSLCVLLRTWTLTGLSTRLPLLSSSMLYISKKQIWHKTYFHLFHLFTENYLPYPSVFSGLPFANGTVDSQQYCFWSSGFFIVTTIYTFFFLFWLILITDISYCIRGRQIFSKFRCYLYLYTLPLNFICHAKILKCSQHFITSLPQTHFKLSLYFSNLYGVLVPPVGHPAKCFR